MLPMYLLARSLRTRLCAATAASMLLMVFATPAHAQSEPATSKAPLLIDVSALEALRAQDNLVILQIGSPAQYEAAHIPGARPVALNDVSTPRTDGALTLELPDSPTLERWARSVGITNRSRIVVVPSTDTLQSSTRVLFTLNFMGLGNRTSLLNGGLSAWRAAGKAIETGAASTLAPSTAALNLVRDSTIVATIHHVASATSDSTVATVDARLPQFYAGQGGGYPRPGHIPSAVNIPLSTVSENGVIKSDAELRALFEKAGVNSGDKVITYCHIGQQASLLWFAAKQLGYDVMLFDGSFQEWSGSDRPLGTPPS